MHPPGIFTPGPGELEIPPGSEAVSPRLAADPAEQGRARGPGAGHPHNWEGRPSPLGITCVGTPFLDSLHCCRTLISLPFPPHESRFCSSAQLAGTQAAHLKTSYEIRIL